MQLQLFSLKLTLNHVRAWLSDGRRGWVICCMAYFQEEETETLLMHPVQQLSSTKDELEKSIIQGLEKVMSPRLIPMSSVREESLVKEFMSV